MKKLLVICLALLISGSINAQEAAKAKSKAKQESTEIKKDASKAKKEIKSEADKTAKDAKKDVQAKKEVISKDVKATKQTAAEKRANAANKDKVTGTYNGKKLYTGPKGGQYYINSSGNKTYIDKK